ncbi:hypothetical protein GGR57DRAFT_506023 [Xylariaceae sp. FL1272]|nr:hypothetical protein GGR57DRAFT_506023 [Xylariaceae sp. FL1272]
MAPDHPYKNLRLPSNAPFELRPSAGKGYGMFAIRDISKGELILHEKPLIAFNMAKQDISHQHIVQALARLHRREKQQFNCIAPVESLHHNESRETNVFHHNSWMHRGGCGMFLLASRINHSCLPSSRMGPGGDKDSQSLKIISRRQIPKGEEITITYYEDFIYKTTAQRRTVTELQWLFACDCQACQVGTPFQLASDGRRVLIAALEHLLNGVKGKVPDMPANISIIPQLALLNGSLPALVRFCYQTILAGLQDTENELSATEARKHQEYHQFFGQFLLQGEASNSQCSYTITAIQNILTKETWGDKAAFAVNQMFFKGGEINFDPSRLPDFRFITNTSHRVIFFG